MTERLSSEYLTRLQQSVNSEENPVKYLAIDPGKSNGVCAYDGKFYLTFMMTIDTNDMVQFLDIFDNVDTCILEDFMLYPNKAKEQIYSDMETSRVIGRTESWAERKKVNLVKQGAKIKDTGYKWIGKKPLPKSNPRNHELDAHVHFMYWAIKNGKIAADKLLK